MGQSTITRNQFVFQGSATNSGGTFISNIAVPIDQAMRLTAYVILSSATSSHLQHSATLEAQASVENSNGVLRLQVANTSSNNPINSNTTDVTGLVGFGVQAGDSTNWNGIHTAVWTVSGAYAVMTVTNNSSTTPANISVIVDTVAAGST